MVIIELDTLGHYVALFPVSREDILLLGEAYVGKEDSLPAAQQLKEPALSLMHDKLSCAQLAADSASEGELQRSESATRLHNTLAELIPLLSLAVDRLKGKYATDLGSLERWGLSTKIGAHGKVSVRKPRSEAQWADFAPRYLEREQALPEADQITDPPLVRVTALTQSVIKNRTARETGSIQRQAGTQTSQDSVAELLDLLKVACGVLVGTRFDRQVTESLGEWGYKVVQHTSSPTPPEDEAQ